MDVKIQLNSNITDNSTSNRFDINTNSNQNLGNSNSFFSLPKVNVPEYKGNIPRMDGNETNIISVAMLNNEKRTLTPDQQYQAKLAYHQTVLDHKRDNGSDDSPLMTAVKNNLRAVNVLLQAEMSDNFDVYRRQLQQLKIAYNKLIESCDIYIKNRPAWWFVGEARRRKNLVKNLKRSALEELKHFRGMQGDGNYFLERKNGMLLGHALCHAIRDYKILDANLEKKFEEIPTCLVRDPSADDHILLADHKEYRMFFMPMPNEIDWRIKEPASCYRLAKFIGRQNVMCPYRKMIVQDGFGKYHYGLAKHKNDGNVMTIKQLKRYYKKVIYSTEAIRMLSQIKLFSLLVGLTKVNEEDAVTLYVSYSRTIDGVNTAYVTGASLDKLKISPSRGYLKYQKEDGSIGEKRVDLGSEHIFKKSKCKELMGQHLESLAADFGIDDFYSKNIQLIDEHDLDYLLGDISTNSERSALVDRLNYLKGELKKYNNNTVQHDNAENNGDIKSWNSKEKVNALKERLAEKGNAMDTFSVFFKDVDYDIVVHEDDYLLKLEKESIERQQKKEQKDRIVLGMLEAKNELLKVVDDLKNAKKELKEWAGTLDDEKADHAAIGSNCYKKFQALKHYYKKAEKIIEANQGLAVDVATDGEIKEHLKFKQDVCKLLEKYVKLINKVIIPKYDVRMEELCKEIAENNKIDELEKNFTHEKIDEFINNWEKAMLAKKYDQYLWKDKEDEFLKNMDSLVHDFSDARKHGKTVPAFMFLRNASKIEKRTYYTRIMALYDLYESYFAKRKELAKKVGCSK